MEPSIEKENTEIKNFFEEYYSGFSHFSPQTREDGWPLSYRFYLTYELVYRDVMRLMIKDLEYKTLGDKKILDVGCGNGRFLRWFQEQGALPQNLYGVDSSDTIIEDCKKISSSLITFKQAMGNQIPFEKGFFDLLLNFGVIIHILDDNTIKAMAQEFKRVLKPEGALILTVTNEEAIYHESWMKQRVRTFDRTKKEVESLFEGWKVLKRYDGYPEFITDFLNKMGSSATDPATRKLLLERPNDDSFLCLANNDFEVFKFFRAQKMGGKSIYVLKP